MQIFIGASIRHSRVVGSEMGAIAAEAGVSFDVVNCCFRWCFHLEMVARTLVNMPGGKGADTCGEFGGAGNGSGDSKGE